MYENASQGHPNYLLLDYFFLGLQLLQENSFHSSIPWLQFLSENLFTGIEYEDYQVCTAAL